MTQILVIGADQTSRQILQRVLEGEGYDLGWAADGATALEKLAQNQPAMVICDWDLPGDHTGLSICQHIHGTPALSTTLCLMLATRRSSAKRIEALEMGADDLLIKPVDPAEIKARVRAGIRMWQLTRDLQKQKHLLEAELSEAEAYVRSLLPVDLTEHVTIRSRFIPSRLLGGDCYDYYWLDPDYLVIYLLDVSGHGLGSALLSTSVLNVLRSQSLPDVNFYRPEKVLKALNETFQMNDQNEKYFTIWYGVYNRANQQLLYASAGHPPAVLVSEAVPGNVTIERLRTAGMPIGMLPDATYTWQRCQVPPNSRLYVFSDGIYEILQADQTLLGLDSFVDILAQMTPQRTVDDILQQVGGYNQQGTFADDLSLLEVCLN
ncbi:PP2C family protein-serine/threonine phosphatase [Leptolyngbya sp. PCC 6406]|uniref:PP2C family protein-serine/threonine phosphatase n=1 Tax=Leptolyngbya sp. PCC 6406 TaxID=1173264 RepID=UPI00048978FC|nr:SpoIIE family protein phosphatase [Leptolyngbya sp. PCC 6406]